MTADFTCQTLDPAHPTGPKIAAVFPGHYTERLYKYAPVDFENLQAAKFVLEHPERIFFGVREYNEGGWCYTGRPERWYLKAAVIRPFPPNLVFAVYLNPMMRVYECRAERVAGDDADAPIDWQARYQGLTWKHTSSQA